MNKIIKILYPLFLILFFIGCKQSVIEFDEFYKKINTLKTPYIINCGFQSNDIQTNIPEEVAEKFAPKNMLVVGRVYPDEPNIYLIFGAMGDILYPYLFIFDKKGNKIDSMYLHINVCMEEQFIEQNSNTVINSDKTINMLDTTRIYKTDSIDNNTVRKLASSSVYKLGYKLSENGLIKEIYKEKE